MPDLNALFPTIAIEATRREWVNIPPATTDTIYTDEEESFRVMTFNLLAQRAIVLKEYPGIEEKFLSSEYRNPALAKQIRSLKPDIIGCQEVQSSQFWNEHLCTLSRSDNQDGFVDIDKQDEVVSQYGMFYKSNETCDLCSKGGSHSSQAILNTIKLGDSENALDPTMDKISALDNSLTPEYGNAIFWNRSRFLCVGQAYTLLSSHSPSSTVRTHNAICGVFLDLSSATFDISARSVQDFASSFKGTFYCVINSHLLFNPRNGDIKLEQSQTLMHFAYEWVSHLYKSNQLPSLAFHALSPRSGRSSSYLPTTFLSDHFVHIPKQQVSTYPDSADCENYIYHRSIADENVPIWEIIPISVYDDPSALKTCAVNQKKREEEIHALGGLHPSYSLYFLLTMDANSTPNSKLVEYLLHGDPTGGSDKPFERLSYDGVSYSVGIFADLQDQVKKRLEQLGWKQPYKRMVPDTDGEIDNNNDNDNDITSKSDSFLGSDKVSEPTMSSPFVWVWPWGTEYISNELSCRTEFPCVYDGPVVVDETTSSSSSSSSTSSPALLTQSKEIETADNASRVTVAVSVIITPCQCTCMKSCTCDWLKLSVFFNEKKKKNNGIKNVSKTTQTAAKAQEKAPLLDINKFLHPSPNNDVEGDENTDNMLHYSTHGYSKVLSSKAQSVSHLLQRDIHAPSYPQFPERLGGEEKPTKSVKATKAKRGKGSIQPESIPEDPLRSIIYPEYLPCVVSTQNDDNGNDTQTCTETPTVEVDSVENLITSSKTDRVLPCTVKNHPLACLNSLHPETEYFQSAYSHSAMPVRFRPSSCQSRSKVFVDHILFASACFEVVCKAYENQGSCDSGDTDEMKDMNDMNDKKILSPPPSQSLTKSLTLERCLDLPNESLLSLPFIFFPSQHHSSDHFPLVADFSLKSFRS